MCLRVIEPEPKMTVSCEHILPALVNELYCVRIKLSSNSDHVKSGKITIPKLDNVNMYNSKLEELKAIEFGEITPNTTHTELLILQFTKKIAMINIKLTVL